MLQVDNYPAFHGEITQRNVKPGSHFESSPTQPHREISNEMELKLAGNNTSQKFDVVYVFCLMIGHYSIFVTILTYQDASCIYSTLIKGVSNIVVDSVEFSPVIHFDQ